MNLLASGLPARSFAPVVMKPLNFLLAAKGFSVPTGSVAPKGSSVAVLLSELRLSVAGIVFHFLVFLSYFWSLKVLEVSESGLISSEKVALTLVVRGAPGAPLSGSRLLELSRTVGAVVSGGGAAAMENMRL